MPRFYLHLCTGAQFTEDEEGHEADDAAAARVLAVAGLRDVLASDLQNGHLSTASFIEIEDQQHQLIATVSFEDVVHLDSQPVTR